MNKSEKQHLSRAQRDLLNGFYLYLKGKRYSKSTVRAYSFLVADFIKYVGNKPIANINNSAVDRYLAEIFVPRGYSVSTQRQFISGLKLFKAFRPDCSIDNLELTRPKRDRILPVVLSKPEVIDLIRCTRNLKHRAILAMIYSSGLRISELLNLRLCDIDIDRRQVHVKYGKGRKDRYVVLSEGFLPLLKNYLTTYRPFIYFAEGPKGKKYTSSSIQKFLKRSCQDAKITKHVTPHTLRHSYATHLLENGVNLRHIQMLLGHSKPETTMIYTHVMKKDLLDIRSPLDSILMSLQHLEDNREHKFMLSDTF